MTLEEDSSVRDWTASLHACIGALARYLAEPVSRRAASEDVLALSPLAATR